MAGEMLPAYLNLELVREVRDAQEGGHPLQHFDGLQYLGAYITDARSHPKPSPNPDANPHLNPDLNAKPTPNPLPDLLY